MGGRTAMTVPIPTGGACASTASISSTAAASLLNATSYTIGDIHATVEEVLAAHSSTRTSLSHAKRKL